MSNHSVYTKSITDKVLVEIVYENTPVFAGEELTTIIRFKNKHDLKVLASKSTNDESSDSTTVTDSDSLSFGKRISLQLSNTARSLFLDQLDTLDEDGELTETLLLGYVQLFGYIVTDETVIDPTTFTESKRSSIIGGKIAGINDFDVSQLQSQSTLTNITSGIGNLLGSTIAEDPSESFKESILLHHSSSSKKAKSTSNVLDLINPIFVTKQSLLFTELILKPNGIKSFYFKSKVPEALPPNFTGKSIYINYNLIIGCQLPTLSNVHKMINKSLYFPLKVFPNIDENGYQPITLPNLNRMLILSKNRDEITTLQENFDRKASFKTIEKSLSKSNNDIQKQNLIHKLENLINDQVITDEKSSIKLTCRENIFLFMDNSLKGIQPATTPSPNTYKQLTKVQNQFTIKRNHKHISKITLTKPIYKIGEDINLIVDFLDSEIQSSGIIISLESFENIDEKYGAYSNSNKEDHTLSNQYISERTKTWYSESINVINHTKINKLINIPLNITPQFQTKFFKLEWYIRFKFILLDDKHKSGGIFNVIDTKNGVLCVGMESFDGTDFNFKIPVVIIPTDVDLNGLV